MKNKTITIQDKSLGSRHGLFKVLRPAFLTVFLGLAPLVSGSNFNTLWYDGNAEISTYEISEMRYGEPRQGTRVMVFVTEPLRLETGIKPDVKLPQKEKVNVMKLNDIRKFPTGVYDYSVMTSVFSAVEKRDNIPMFGTMKVSFTSQEWCGNVFERMLRRDGQYHGELFSYFESEGESAYIIPHQGRIEAEENLWILIRELEGPVLEYGESREITVTPSMWSRRKAHSTPRTVTGTLSKGPPGKTSTPLGEFESVTFTWMLETGTTEVQVEKAWPHRILSWTEPDGSVGALKASSREPYWQQNGNEDSQLRSKLGLRLQSAPTL
ncbi:hypothetical protein ACFL5V_06420 [Fibrobacterota bacterium]